jgi:signal transduction histidine kinase
MLRSESGYSQEYFCELVNIVTFPLVSSLGFYIASTNVNNRYTALNAPEMTMDQPFTLENVIINSELARRKSRPPDYEAESAALEVLAQTMADSPQSLLQKLVEIALQLCRADTAGISLLENYAGDEVFRWEALAGVLSDHLKGTMPRYASPSGITIDQNATQLMYLPERFFRALKVEPPVVEALLIPFHVQNEPVGTIWVVAHSDQRKFDREDERLIRTLAQFAAAGWQLWKAQTTAEAAVTFERELTKDMAARNEALNIQVSDRKRAEEELQQLNTDLESRVAQGRMDLATANADLERSVEKESKLQEQLRQSQKMESIGKLVGGIAHDFNNLLNIVQGYVSVMREDLGDPIKLEESIGVIDGAIEEGASLVQQLLTIARKHNVKFELINVNSLLQSMNKWLENTLPKTITIHLQLDLTMPHIRADANQLNQVLLNLCLNANDAMAGSGKLRLSTTVVAGNDLQNRFPGIENQRYVCITVADTGTGIDENIRERIFEPFFTTKEQEKGTGLGLSVSYGIVKTHRGFIDFDSELGRGTTFHIYLPIG